ncbi:hypothetical protein NB613_07005 [Vibrio parahaemolyticus]|uniref:hypothetical protein n=1 Tax=Vibrio parahaemolyticus TaxID=670 RepID=UPI001869D141|nr:hypothetical protein [Vibrio parahaemolyticus]MBE3992664.1 DUF342 domain-containing protein [Vibrio parahaemolyticus]MCR9851760.1 hypothetical protein [Vibrio parahaemolyticus]
MSDIKEIKEELNKFKEERKKIKERLKKDKARYDVCKNQGGEDCFNQLFEKYKNSNLSNIEALMQIGKEFNEWIDAKLKEKDEDK